jgi:small-conductance mechanosensitive channel
VFLGLWVLAAGVLCLHVRGGVCVVLLFVSVVFVLFVIVMVLVTVAVLIVFFLTMASFVAIFAFAVTFSIFLPALLIFVGGYVLIHFDSLGLQFLISRPGTCSSEHKLRRLRD